MLKNKSSSKGFSLIELAITMVIVGVLIGVGATTYNIWQIEKNHSETKQKVDDIAYAVQAYIATNGHYPCPSSLTAARGNAGYGRQTDCSNPGQVAAGTFNAGLGIGAATSLRPAYTADFNGDGSDTTEVPRVRIGAIPFRDLKLRESLQFDAYGSRIRYAITEFMADPAVTLQRNVGGISIIDNAGNSLLGTDHSADFIVIAHGADKAGGYNIAGKLTSPCEPAAADGENCDINSVFRVDNYAENLGGSHFDDLVTYNTPLSFPKWVKSNANPDNIHTLNDNAVVAADGSYDFLVADINAVNPDSRLWIKGTARIDGDLKSDQLCDEKLEDCFDADMIGGTGIACDPSNPLMNGIELGDSRCINSINQDCSSKSNVIGSINGGVVSCAPCVVGMACYVPPPTSSGGTSTSSTSTTSSSTTTSSTTSSSGGPPSCPPWGWWCGRCPWWAWWCGGGGHR